ncbi:PQQ-dependent sugar dehydrogenase [candidate division KSB1 bacterium]|nr:PQQ-dependent sugar dehydrogenase [candidate division KSB1 bacterium]
MQVNPKDYLDKIKLPPGFKIEMYAENVEGARSMALGAKGTLFVGTRRRGRNIPGKVYAIIDKNNDFKADEVITIATDLNVPNGVAFHKGDLYVAEISRVIKFENIENQLAAPPQPKVINDRFPTDTWHGWKFIRFGPDGKLYVPVGAPCNICERQEEIFATITRINPDGSELEIYAKGIRNTVGFDWHPVTKELWFTENGRDEMGEDIPPEELNHAPQPGLHFGFPYRYGKALIDTTFKTAMGEDQFQPAAIELPAHVAALGMRFYTGTSFPQEYHQQVFIAEHGSWNRSVPDGYRVSLVKLKDNRAASYEHFATGWLQNNQYWGRPVDVLVMPDGSLLVSDDFANCIYRIVYSRRK